MGVPILQRRRLIGAAVACFPAREILDDDERLARMCDYLELDQQVIENYAKRCRRHDAEQGKDFLQILDWLLTQEQIIDTAQNELATLSDNLTSTYEELNLLYRVSGSMQVTQCPQQFLQNVCDDLLEVVDSSVAAVAYAHPPAVEEDIIVVAGGEGVCQRQIKDLADGLIAQRLAQAGGPIVDNTLSTEIDSVKDHAIRNLIAVPLTSDGEQIGMLIGFNKTGDFDTIDIKLLNSIGDQAAVFLANSRLFADLQDLLMGVLHALTASIDAKDPYTCGHSQRVAIISRRLAEACGYSPAKVQRIYLTGLLHDVGKIGIPESVLRKPGRLTDEEFECIKSHPGISAKILGGIRQLEDIVPGIVAHHERLDGRGYPNGLKGDEVPIEGLIVGLADSFDAMTSDRTYRKALELDTVVEEIGKCVGTQFHADLVEKFLSFDLDAFLDELRKPTRTVFPVNFVQEGAI